jgi:hypothetical protein
MVRKLCSGLALLALAGALTACESRSPGERAGGAIDRAGTRTGEAVGRAFDATGNALHRAGEWVQEKTR